MRIAIFLALALSGCQPTLVNKLPNHHGKTIVNQTNKTITLNDGTTIQAGKYRFK